MPHILHVVVVSVLLAPFDASAQTDEDSHVPFGLTCDVVQVEGEEHDLVFDLDLGPGDWVVSSHSTDSMFGKFSLRFQEPQAIQLIGSIEEFPPSAWEVEHFSQLDIKVIRQDTRLVQRVAINKAHQGELNGVVFFVLNHCACRSGHPCCCGSRQKMGSCLSPRSTLERAPVSGAVRKLPCRRERESRHPLRSTLVRGEAWPQPRRLRWFRRRGRATVQCPMHGEEGWWPPQNLNS